jgi:transcriptional regulator with XRE-family HTH domain
MRTNIDVVRLETALDSRIQADHLSRRRAAAQIGVSASLLSPLRSGQRPDLDAYVSIVRWLRMSTEDFLLRNDQEDQLASPLAAKSQPELTSAVSALLRGRHDLSDEEKTLLEVVFASGLQLVKTTRLAMSEH